MMGSAYHGEVRERIIEAAMKVFSAYGFFKAPVHLIAREADISKGLIFWYFDSKDKLIKEVIKRSLPMDLVRRILETESSGKDLLKLIAERYIEYYSNNPFMRNLLLNSLATENVYPTIKGEIDDLCGRISREVAKRAFGNDDTDNFIKIRIFFGGLLCYVLRPLNELERKEYIDVLIETLTK